MNTIELNNGIKMPMLGYGVFLVGPQECEYCVSEAIRLGYRLIDTAQAYYNEEGSLLAITMGHTGQWKRHTGTVKFGL